MAGSKRELIYITDIPTEAGDELKVMIIDQDESNGKLTGGVEATPGNLSGAELAQEGQDYKYRGLRPRRLLLQGLTSGGRTVRRSIIANDPGNVLVRSGGTTVMGVMVGNESEAVTMTVTGVVGERRTFPRSVDTGLDDGTAT